MLIALLAMVLFAMRQAGWLDPVSGTFIAIDGDSLRKGKTEFRLHAIDAPELNQTCLTSSGRTYPCGREARQALKLLTTNRSLECQVFETDRYGRGIATCVSDKLEINAEMVRLGWAIAYRRHGLGYVGAEAEARKARRGIWQGAFEDPEDWRASHRAELIMGGMSAEEIAGD
jgi:endonuclease YncB( thermonuclease family)